MIYLIYKIHCNVTGDDYYGSTKNLIGRMSVHKCDTEKENSRRKCRSKEIIKRGDYVVSVIETMDVETKQDAFWRERYYIKNYPCVNSNIPIKTKEELKENQTQYRIDNRETLLIKKAEYRKTHAKELSAKQMVRHNANKDEINTKRREIKIRCDVCNIDINKGHKARHEKTAKHLQHLL